MPRKPDLAELIKARIISNRRARAFVREAFLDLGGYDQVGRALSQLVAEGVLVRVSSGVYTKARLSRITGRPVPRKPVISVAFEALRKLGYTVAESNAAREYRAGKTTQVPAKELINIGSQRVSRRFGFGNSTVSYEKTKSTNQRA